MTTSTTSRSRLQNSFLARVDYSLLLTLALSVFALWPLLYRLGLPNGNDVLYHVYRAAEMDRAWSHGVLFPRWAESFYTGYGAPVFHYYASLSYYVTSLLMRLFGLTALDSLRLLIALCVVGAAAGTYLFVHRRAGLLGGVIAALCYVYSPYMLFTEPYSRGAYPELAALALFPLVMWRYDRLLLTMRGRDVLLAALLSAALILTHNLMGLVLTGLLFAWLTWTLLTHGRTGLRPHLFVLLTAIIGIGLAAYFWIPVILESGEVRLGNLTAVAQLDYRNFFVPLDKLLAFSPRFDAGAVNGLQHQFNLGVPQWILTLTGLLGSLYILRRVGEKRPTLLSDLIFFALAGGLSLLLLLPLAEPIWGAVSPLAFLQFPWRFLGSAGFCLAVLAGMNALWIDQLPERVRGIITTGILLAIVAAAMPLFYITEWHHLTVDTSVAAYQQAEVRGLQRATTFSNEYLPKTVEVEPDPTTSLLADYADGYPVSHLNPAALPSGVTAALLDNNPQQSTWVVNAAESFTLEVLIFDFAGWTAEIDGQSVPITPSNPHGLITFPVPAGEHTVRVYLGSTPARDLGIVVTLFSTLLLLAITVRVIQRNQRTAASMSQNAALETQGFVSRIPHNVYFLPLSIAFLLVLLLVALYMREGVAWVNSPPGQAILAQHPTDYRLGDNIRLLGYNLNADSLNPGDSVELSVYWYTDAPIPYGYATFVHISTGGPPFAQADKQNPAGRPTKEWTSEGYIRDDYTLHLPDTMPPGDYQLLIGLYTCDTLPTGECGNGDRLTVTTADGNPVGDAVQLQTITVR